MEYFTHYFLCFLKTTCYVGSFQNTQKKLKQNEIHPASDLILHNSLVFIDKEQLFIKKNIENHQ